VLLLYRQQADGAQSFGDLSSVTPFIMAKCGMDLKSLTSQPVSSPLARFFLRGKRSYPLAVLLVVSGHGLW